MLESSKESLKLEAMKRIVGVSASWEGVFPSTGTDDRNSGAANGWSCLFCAQLIAMGKNSSELFPAVVKNVASKNIEVRRQENSSSGTDKSFALCYRSFLHLECVH